MTDAPTTPAKTTALQYRNRAWLEVEFDFPWNDSDMRSPGEIAYANGWLRITQLGDENSLSVAVHARRDARAEDKGPHYFAFYNLAATLEIVVLPRLQDLIDFLAYVSTTILAAVVPSDTWEVLNDLLARTPTRTADRERERERLAKFESEHVVRLVQVVDHRLRYRGWVTACEDDETPPSSGSCQHTILDDSGQRIWCPKCETPTRRDHFTRLDSTNTPKGVP